MIKRKVLHFALTGGVVATLSSSCRPKSETSEVKGSAIECMAVNALSGFVGSIPIPGFSFLSKVPQMVASAVAGSLKSEAQGRAAGLGGCNDTAPSDISEKSLGQIREIVRDSFNEQNHNEAKATLATIDTSWRRFVPDIETPHDYTMNNLEDMVRAADGWWARYDLSGQRIFNVNDFILVTGVEMKALQEQVRSVALGAAKTGGAEEIQRVRSYASNLSRSANHARQELLDIAEKDIYGMARAMYNMNQVDDGPMVYDGAAFYAHANVCYFSKNRQAIDPSKPKAAHETHSINELSAWLGMYGQVCCSRGRDGTCKNSDGKIEVLIEKRIDALAQQIQRVMFSENAAIQEYAKNTLPTLISAADKIASAPNDAVIALAGQGSIRLVNNSTASNGSFCPDGSNGAGKGFGSIYTCGDKQCAKSDKDGVNQCVIAAGAGSSNSGGFCPNGTNGAGKGYGIIYTCGDKQCAKSDKDGVNQCVIAAGAGSSNSGGFCPDGSNGSGKGFGIIYTCGDKQCAKSDKDGVNQCVIASASGDGFCPDGSNGSGKGFGIIYTCGDKQCAKSDKDGVNQCVIRK
ncbi:MAG: hypothetical protein NTX25_06445 [Proteobacteria bacterium]|nr:hypothetical protein [Pseudomonadota bacterium]